MLEVDSISKYFIIKNKHNFALREISFKIEKPEILGVMGKSGSGKTTLLRIISGLVLPSTGVVKLNGEFITKPTKKIGMVFQDYTAFPWLTVEKNIEFGLKIANISAERIINTTNKMLDATNLENHRKMYPATLSGGQRQRLAIARALAVEPDVLLMDEPFGALDDDTKYQMLDFIKSIWIQMPFKMIFVTHSRIEAEKICDRIIKLDG